MKSSLHPTLFFLFIAASAAFAQQVLENDGFDEIASMQCRVRDVVEVNRVPLFDNAPFLRLRKGDKLVKARKEVVVHDKPSANPDEVYYYLFSGGQYYQLWTEEDDGKVLLSRAFWGANNCLLFNWDLTMENARSLRQLLPNKYVKSRSIVELNAEFRAVAAAVQKEFPEAIGGVHPDFHEDRMRSIPGHSFAEFQGLSFDYHRNQFCHYTLRIGPETFSIREMPLLQGPERVERHEFERVEARGPNAPTGGALGTDLDPAVAKIRKAQYEKMLRFRKLVEDAQNSKP